MEAQPTTFCNYPNEDDETFFFFNHDFHQGAPLSNYPERLGIISSDVAVPALADSNSTNHVEKPAKFGSNNRGCDFRSDCCHYFDYYNLIDRYGKEAKQAAAVVPVVEDSESRVGKYTVEERKDRILRYLKKRNQRNFNKTIKYACRKTLADRRVRVRGRFARNNGSCEVEMPIEKTNKEADHPQQRNNDFFFGDSLQMKQQDGDEWLQLQAAIASLIYLPYVN